MITFDETRMSYPRISCPRMFVAVVLGATLGCSSLAGDQQLPAGTPSPSDLHTEAGALGMRSAAVTAFQKALLTYLVESGQLTDELSNRGTKVGVLQPGPVTDPLDERILPQSLDLGLGNSGRDSYGALQYARATASQAIVSLATYAPDLSPALRGELYAMDGYTELMLADLFCSGVPLSTLDFNGDYTLHAGSTTQQLYTTALAKFDTALALSDDSVRIKMLATVGKARVLVEMDSLAAAAPLAAMVPTSFTYTLPLQWENGADNVLNGTGTSGSTVSDHEGVNGLPYLSSGDPRSVATTVVDEPVAFFPTKYVEGLTGDALVNVADGVEARLIEAEAAVRAHNSNWLTILNTLRTDGTVASTYTRTCQDGVSSCPAGVVDTTWGAGTGIGLIPASVRADAGPQCTDPGSPCTDTVWYKGLRPLTDPGTDSARVALVIQERAYWLFITGHRQGDLRRLVRNYHWRQDGIYPRGPYFARGTGTYGSDVNAPIPEEENANPLFHGCFDRHA